MRKAPIAMFVLGLVFAGASSLFAQDMAKVTVNFPFVVNGTVLPAGSYTVYPASDNLQVVSIMSNNGRKIVLSDVHNAGEVALNAKPTFEFKKFGDTYFLWKVNVPGDESHEISLPSREVADTLARLAQDHGATPTETGAQR